MDVCPTSEAARRLGIHHRSVSRLIRAGRLRAVKVGRTWVVRPDDLEELAKAYEGRRGRLRAKP